MYLLSYLYSLSLDKTIAQVRHNTSLRYSSAVLEHLRVSALDIFSNNFLAISEIFVMLNIITISKEVISDENYIKVFSYI